MQPISVVVSEDRMAASVLISPGCNAGAQDVRDALKRAGVTSGISPKAILEAINGPRGVAYRVAWAVLPRGAETSQPARASLVLRFPTSRAKPRETYAVGPSFKAEWGRLQDRGAVRAGDVLAAVRAPSDLLWATTVTGERVPFLDFGPDFRLGLNAKFSADGLKIVATRSGIPYVDDREAAGVLDHVAIEGDVGTLTGDLSFPGDLTVRGNVMPGFGVFVSGDLLVSGHVWGSATARGRIVVSGGITAPGGIVEAGAGISCRFCENSVLRSQGPVEIQEAALHSVIETEDRIQVSTPKGRVIGGLLRAALSVKACTVGTPMGLPTVVELGISPRIRREAVRLERELEKITSELDRIRRAGRTRASGLSDMDLMRLARARRNLEEQEKALSDHLQSLRERMEGMPKGFFQAERVLPGTRLVMGTDVHEFTSGIDRISMGVRDG